MLSADRMPTLLGGPLPENLRSAAEEQTRILVGLFKAPSAGTEARAIRAREHVSNVLRPFSSRDAGLFLDEIGAAANQLDVRGEIDGTAVGTLTHAMTLERATAARNVKIGIGLFLGGLALGVGGTMLSKRRGRSLGRHRR